MEIHQYINLIKRWSWLIILVSVLGIIAGYVFSRYQTPIYHAQTMIMVMQNQDNNLPSYLFVDNKQIAETYTQLIATQPVISATSQRLGYPISANNIQVSQVPNAELIELGVDDPDPQRAADITNTLVTMFLEQNQTVQASRYASSEESLQT